MRLTNNTNQENRNTSLESLAALGAIYSDGKLADLMKDTKKIKAQIETCLRTAKERKSSFISQKEIVEPVQRPVEKEPVVEVTIKEEPVSVPEKSVEQPEKSARPVRSFPESENGPKQYGNNNNSNRSDSPKSNINNNQTGSTNGQRPWNNNNNNNGQRSFNNQNGQRNYNNQSNGQRPFNNQNGTANTQRPWNNNYNNNGQRPFNNQNNSANAQRPFNNQNGTANTQRPWNSNYNNNGQRPFNNQNNGPRPWNNQNGASNTQRPFNTNGPRPWNNQKPQSIIPKGDSLDTLVVKDSTKYACKKNNTNYNKSYDEKKSKSKKQLFNYGYGNNDFEEDVRINSRKLKVKKEKQEAFVSAPVTKAVITTDNITVKLLSESIGKSVAEIVKKLILLGVMATINSQIDYTTAELVANDLGIELEQRVDKTFEEQLTEKVQDSVKDEDSELVRRPPVITVMGHVDHGKTSLLDAIKKTDVVATEAGGITQHIGAYTIRKNDRMITFIDTPGHAAFTAMRARGAQITDIAILVVAADDGIMPQTIEAINHIKAAKVPMIVAINKMDKPGANPDRIKQQLTEYGVVPEEWGGDAIIVPISAKTGAGIDKLLEMMLLVADVADLKANPKRQAVGTIIEAKLDRGRGPVATVLIQNGTLKIGNTVVSGTTLGRIRAMIDSTGKNIVSAGPSIAVSVLGFEDVPEAGDKVQAVDEKFSKQIIQERKVKQQLEKIKSSGGVSLDEFMSQTATNEVKNLNVIVKADVQGSLEAIKQSLLDLNTDEVKINFIHGGVGTVTETDILLAQASDAKIIVFNLKNEAKITAIAEKANVEIKNYNIIYQALDDITLMMKGLKPVKYNQVVIGHAEVRIIYKITGAGIIAGSYVTDGKILRGAKARLIRDGVTVEESKIESIKIFKDDAKEAKEGFECGIKIDCTIKEGDIIEAYVEEEIKAWNTKLNV